MTGAPLHLLWIRRKPIATQAYWDRRRPKKKWLTGIVRKVKTVTDRSLRKSSKKLINFRQLTPGATLYFFVEVIVSNKREIFNHWNCRE